MDKDQALQIFSALSQETRLDALTLLVQAGTEGIKAGDVARHLGVRHNLMSQHLSILGAAGLVRSERFGRTIFYRADFEALRGVASFLMARCCQGLPEIIEGLEASALKTEGAIG
ncbi:MAG: metalloregulator ArsR/SmtB family transcription factor [Pseudomonadota bacterium]